MPSLLCSRFLAATLLFSPIALAVPLAAQEAPAPAFTPFENAVPADSITTADLNKQVTVFGKLVQFLDSPASNVPYRLMYGADAASGLTLVFWVDKKGEILGDTATLEPGTAVTARGKVSQYQNNLQIRIASGADIRIEGVVPTVTPAAPPASAKPGADGYFTIDQYAALTTLMGKEISFKGPISAFRASWSERAPNTVSVQDATSKLDIVYWKKEGEPVLFDKVGSTIYATGTLEDFQGRRQLKLADHTRISYEPLAPELMAAPAAAAAKNSWAEGAKTAFVPGAGTSLPAGVTALGAISPALAGTEIDVVATIVAERTQGAVVSLLLRDNSGQIVAYLAEGVAAPQKGSNVRLKGNVNKPEGRESLDLRDVHIVPAGN